MTSCETSGGTFASNESPFAAVLPWLTNPHTIEMWTNRFKEKNVKDGTEGITMAQNRKLKEPKVSSDIFGFQSS